MPDFTPLGLAIWGAFRDRPEVAKRVVGAVCGRGSGKTLLGGTRALHLAMTIDVSGLGKGEKALCPIIGPDLDVAQQAVRFALGAAEAIGLRIEQRTAGGDGGFTIVRKSGHRIRIAPRSASTRGRAGRGYSIPCAILDEAAFFRDASHQVNDQDIFDALRPRIMPGGQIVLLSSPWAESGLLYDLWRRNFSHPQDALIAHAPTGLMRLDDEQILADIEAERRVDPEKTARERDAQFMTSNAQAFFDARAIARMLVDEEPELKEKSTKVVGGDFAFRRNSSAFVSCQTYFDKPKHSNRAERLYEITGLLERRPEGEPLKPSLISKEAAEFTKESGTDEIIADGHYREAVAEYLHQSGVVHVIAPEGASGKADVYQIARTLIHEGNVKLGKTYRTAPDLSDRLVRQLREITSRPLAGGGTAFDSPTWRTGEHGDLASAFMLALWRAYKLGFQEPEESAASKAGLPEPDELERQCMEDAAEQAEKTNRFRRFLGL